MKPRQALMATAASTAEPPRLSMSMPTWVAMGWAVPAAPLQPRAGEREAKLAPEGRSPAWTSGRRKRSSVGGWNLGRALSEFGEGLAVWAAAMRSAGGWSDGGSGNGEREGGEELAAAHRYRLQVTGAGYSGADRERGAGSTGDRQAGEQGRVNAKRVCDSVRRRIVQKNCRGGN